MSIVKLLHVLLVIVWMGSLLTLSRLMLYLKGESADFQERMRAIYKRLYLFADLPAMIGAVALGLLLIFVKGVDFKAPWFHMKMTLAALLIFADLAVARQLFRKEKTLFFGRKVVHSMIGLFLIGILFSIYVLKPAAKESSFAWQKKSSRSTLSGQVDIKS